MGFKVDYGVLNELDYGMNSQCSLWQNGLENMDSTVTILTASANLSGNAADNIKAYFKNVHGTIISLLGELIYLHSASFKAYKSEYQSGIDTDLHAIISSDELERVRNVLKSNNDIAIAIDEELTSVLSEVRDLFCVAHRDISDTADANIAAKEYAGDLEQSITELEESHMAKDFEATDALISSVTTFINEYLQSPAGTMSSFNIMTLAASSSFMGLYEAHNMAYGQIKSRENEFNNAIEKDAEYYEAILKEFEEREKTANAIKWVVTGVCIIGSIVAIGATGGAATPLVVASVSAASGAIMAGTNNLADQYVMNGNLIENGVDWGSFGEDVFVAGVSGFVTGYVGASVGGAITSKLGGTAIGETLLHSGSSIVRVGTAATIGAASEVGSGILSRGVGTLISTKGDFEKAWDEATDMKSIAFDAVIGGVGGGINEYTSTKQAQQAADDYASTYNSKHNPLQDGEDYGLENLKQTANGGVDFSDSDYILRTETGEPIQVKIKATGDRAKDYRLAEQTLREDYGIDMDFKSMRTGSDKTYVWHHLDDYNAATNETTMQFIEIDAHKAIKQHAGSAKQYHIANGQGYGKDSFDAAYGFDPTDEMATIKNGLRETADNTSRQPSMPDHSYNIRMNQEKFEKINSLFDSMGILDMAR